jgi:hypothetical protein
MVVFIKCSYTNYLQRSNKELQESVQFERIKQQIHLTSQPECTFRQNMNNLNNDKSNEAKEGFSESTSTKRNKREDDKISQGKDTSFSKASQGNRMNSSLPDRESIEDRLYRKGFEQMKKKEKMKKQYHEKQAEECSFSPKISVNSRSLFSKINNSPLHERVFNE